MEISDKHIKQYFEMGGLEYTKRESHSIFLEAMRHGASDKSLNTYQRLEFVGDRIYDAIISYYLFTRFPDASEHELSRYKINMAEGRHMCEMASRLHLYRFLQVHPSLEDKRLHDNPAIREDLFESFVGAMFKCEGFKRTYTWVTFMIETYLDIARISNEDTNYFPRMQILCPSVRIDVTKDDSRGRYRDLFTASAIDQTTRTTLATHTGPTKKHCIKMACRDALVKCGYDLLFRETIDA